MKNLKGTGLFVYFTTARALAINDAELDYEYIYVCKSCIDVAEKHIKNTVADKTATSEEKPYPICKQCGQEGVYCGTYRCNEIARCDCEGYCDGNKCDVCAFTVCDGCNGHFTEVKGESMCDRCFKIHGHNSEESEEDDDYEEEEEQEEDYEESEEQESESEPASDKKRKRNTDEDSDASHSTLKKQKTK